MLPKENLNTEIPFAQISYYEHFVKRWEWGWVL